MRIDKILAGLKEEKAPKAAEKVASAAPAETAAPRDALLKALDEAVAKPAEKVASVATSPADDVMKIASELLAADKEAAIKEAQVLGAAFGDAAVARLGTWTKAAQEMLAAAPAPSGSATEEQLKQAAEYGYNLARQEIEKVAADEYNRGWNETVEAIYKTAADEFTKAAAITDRMIQ